MFTAAVFAIADTRKQSKCSPTDPWLEEMWGVCVCVCVVEYHSVIKKNEILPFVPTQVDLETIIPSEINRERRVLHDIIHIWNVKSNTRLNIHILNRNRFTET